MPSVSVSLTLSAKRKNLFRFTSSVTPAMLTWHAHLDRTHY